jgi:hypothetical protein
VEWRCGGLGCDASVSGSVRNCCRRGDRRRHFRRRQLVPRDERLYGSVLCVSRRRQPDEKARRSLARNLPKLGCVLCVNVCNVELTRCAVCGVRCASLCAVRWGLRGVSVRRDAVAERIATPIAQEVEECGPPSQKPFVKKFRSLCVVPMKASTLQRPHVQLPHALSIVRMATPTTSPTPRQHLPANYRAFCPCFTFVTFRNLTSPHL